MTSYLRWLGLGIFIVLCEVEGRVDFLDFCKSDLALSNVHNLKVLCDTVRSLLSTDDFNDIDWSGQGDRGMRNARDTSDAEETLRRISELDQDEKRNGMYFGMRNLRGLPAAPGSYFGIRNRRGGNYIRFGRSLPDVKVQEYLAGFGSRDPRSSGGRYMRFGRSTDHVIEAAEQPQTETDEEKRFMRFGKKDGGEEIAVDGEKDKRFMRFGRGFMRFGRDSNGFMRFGRDGFMRFGKRDEDGSDNDEESAEKRFMRFGRDPAEDQSSELEGISDVQEADKRGFMRFGKRGFMRFGKRADVDADEGLAGKRYMRFGKRDGSEEMDEEKRGFMRFGKRSEEDDEKRGFMRFGKRSEEDDEKRGFMRFGKRFMRFGRGGEEDNEEKRGFMRFGKRQDSLMGDKRYMRFGKRDGSDAEEKRGFMRFGKREAEEGESGADKRFMRFGKRFMRFGKSGSEEEKTEDKKFMRFGKKNDEAQAENAVIKTDSEDAKRFMRFGKKSSTS